MTRHALLLALAASLAACAVGPNYRAPETKTPARFGEAPAGDAGAPLAAWWTTFKDPTLDALVARAVRGNPDLRRAAARVREARAQRGVAASDALPTVDAAGSASRNRISDHIGDAPGGTSNLFQAGFDALWEIDVFGGVRRGVEAADADVGAAVEDRRDVLVTLVAEVARSYVDLRAAQRQAAIARANLGAQRETFDLTKTRLQGGIATDLDVARSEAQAATTEASIPAFEAQARVAAHALAVLVGEPPDALVGELSTDAAIPSPPPEVPVGLPSDLLKRRPDVRRAERRLAAATARIGEATAEWFPKFSLTGALGLASDGLGRFVDAHSETASAGGAVRWRVLDFGRIAGNIDAADAREQQAADAYEATVLQSFREVDDALVLLSKERARRASLAAAEAASKRAVDLSQQLWKAGRTDFLAVLDSQRDLFFAQDALVQSDRRAAQNLVALYKALGGGWDVEGASDESGRGGNAGAREFDVSGGK